MEATESKCTATVTYSQHYTGNVASVTGRIEHGEHGVSVYDGRTLIVTVSWESLRGIN